MSSLPVRTLRNDPWLHARVLRSVQLRYAEGPDVALDRPAHVRAGSGVAWVDDRLAVVQDDAAFLALIDPATSEARAIALPSEEGGVRQFDDARGNKHLKADLEACVTVPDEGREVLLAFGSGSTPRRERILVVRGVHGDEGSLEMVDASPLYALLRAEVRFSGSEMNVEGAALVGRSVRLFNRGNGAPRGGIAPVDASCDIPLAALLAFLRDPTGPPPAPTDVAQYTIGALDGLRLGFTDATTRAGRVFFSAAAEDSPDATRDGRVAGSVVGVLEDEGGRWTLLLGTDGAPFDGKVEGIVPSRTHPDLLWAVVDTDDAAQPSMLLEVELAGDWPG
jgi:hypothetical protein